MRSFPRSTAIEYWMRSFVPMEKKSHLAREKVRGDGGARNLDHGADFHLLVEGNAFRAQLLAAFLEHGIGAAQFIHAGDHRIHHADVPNDAGAQDRAELHLENLRLLEAEADGAPAEEGIQLLRANRARS